MRRHLAIAVILCMPQLLVSCVTAETTSTEPTKFVTLEPSIGPIDKNLIDFKKFWLTKQQASDFERYLNIIEKGKYPVGLFVVADDEASAWWAWYRTRAEQNIMVRRTLEKCQERSSVPQTCKIFAVNEYMVATGRALTPDTLSSEVLIRPTEVAQIEAARRKIRVDWGALGPAFQFVAIPALNNGSWKLEFTNPEGSISCVVEGQLQKDGEGTWRANCSNDLQAIGESTFNAKAKYAINHGKDEHGGEVLILSTPLPENVRNI